MLGVLFGVLAGLLGSLLGSLLGVLFGLRVGCWGCSLGVVARPPKVRALGLGCVLRRSKQKDPRSFTFGDGRSF
mgnify:CR=1 FL=1